MVMIPLGKGGETVHDVQSGPSNSYFVFTRDSQIRVQFMCV